MTSEFAFTVLIFAVAIISFAFSAWIIYDLIVRIRTAIYQKKLADEIDKIKYASDERSIRRDSDERSD